MASSTSRLQSCLSYFDPCSKDFEPFHFNKLTCCQKFTTIFFTVLGSAGCGVGGLGVYRRCLKSFAPKTQIEHFESQPQQAQSEHTEVVQTQGPPRRPAKPTHKPSRSLTLKLEPTTVVDPNAPRSLPTNIRKLQIQTNPDPSHHLPPPLRAVQVKGQPEPGVIVSGEYHISLSQRYSHTVVIDTHRSQASTGSPELQNSLPTYESEAKASSNQPSDATKMPGQVEE